MTSPTGNEPPEAPVAPDASALAELAGALALGVLCVRDGCVVWANHEITALSGHGPRILSLKVEDLFADSGRGLPRDAGPARVECWLPQASGSRREVVCYRLGGRGGSGGETATWVVEDRTHLRTLEREVHREGRELSARNREVEALRERLQSERAEREELLSVVSHELRTPVTVIRGYNRLLLEEEVGPLTEDQRRFLEESQKACERVNGFVSNLVEASRVEKGAAVLELGHGPVRPVVEGVAAMLRPLREDRDMSLAIEGEAHARFDRLRLEQVLTNLLGNAIKYGRSGGSLEVTLRRLAGDPPNALARPLVEVAVTDDGPGIDEADWDRVFDPYVQLGEGGRPGGLGLGLAICRRLVEAHGGEIRVEPAASGGARFAFTLPASEEPS